MTDYPYKDIAVAWKRPDIDRAVLRNCMQKSDVLGLLHCIGVLAVLTASGSFAYLMYAQERWLLMALALYLHGALFAFNPQTHEFSHGTVFRTKWLNSLFKRVFGILHWTSNGARYKMSHMYHHQYTTHRKSDGEVVLPMPETTERILAAAVQVVDVTGFVTALYHQIYLMIKPTVRNPRLNTWQRYVYQRARVEEQRDAYWTTVSQVVFHVAFAVFAILIDRWFLIVVVSLPQFYGGKWYHLCVHDTMHVGREPETDDFRKCCRSVKVDPFTSFMYWHMEYHTEHHAYAGLPCYRLKKFHALTRACWDPPQSLVEAWREMNRRSEADLCMPPRDDAKGSARGLTAH